MTINNNVLEGKKNYNAQIFNMYRDFGFKNENTGGNPIVFPSSGISYIKDQSIFNNLFEGLSVSFVHEKNDKFPESTALEVGGEFIGWMPRETAKNYVEKELPRGYQWEGILKYIYKPEINSQGKVIKNAGIRVELVPQKSSPEEIKEMINKLSKIHKNYTTDDIEKIYNTINSDKYYYHCLYDTRTIFNAINVLLKNNINIEDFHNLLFKETYFQSEEDFLKKLLDISKNREESFYNLIQNLVHFERYYKINYKK